MDFVSGMMIQTTMKSSEKKVLNSSHQLKVDASMAEMKKANSIDIEFMECYSMGLQHSVIVDCKRFSLVLYSSDVCCSVHRTFVLNCRFFWHYFFSFDTFHFVYRTRGIFLGTEQRLKRNSKLLQSTWGSNDGIRKLFEFQIGISISL